MEHRRSRPPSVAAAGALLCLALLLLVVGSLSPAAAATADGCPAGGERLHKQGSGADRGRSGRHQRKHKEQLWVFGDSYADTGNLGNLGRELTHAWYDPYGQTFPRRPAGRFSDGRVLTDYVDGTKQKAVHHIINQDVHWRDETELSSLEFGWSSSPFKIKEVQIT